MSRESVKYETVRVANLEQWLMAVNQLEAQAGARVLIGRQLKPQRKWIYRGQADQKWSLASSFNRCIGKMCKRHNVILDEKARRSLEASSIANFRSYAPMFGVKENLSPIEWLALMQHQQCPTRLIDFTESPYVALFHAVNDESRMTTDFAVFAFRQDYIIGTEVFDDKYQDKPEHFYSEMFDLSFEQEKHRQNANWIISPSEYQKPQDIDNSRVLCIYPKFRNARLAAQSGLFLMPTSLATQFEEQLYVQLGLKIDDGAKELKELSEVLKRDRFIDYAGIKFVFDKKLRQSVQCLLRTANITYRVMFPDLSGLAKDVKETYFNSKIVKSKPNRIKRPLLNLPMKLPVLDNETFINRDKD